MTFPVGLERPRTFLKLAKVRHLFKLNEIFYFQLFLIISTFQVRKLSQVANDKAWPTILHARMPDSLSTQVPFESPSAQVPECLSVLSVQVP